MEERIKVLFIAGWGRSGSTLLDRMLGCVEGFESIGEVSRIWRQGFVNDQLCGCGTRFSDCPYWQAVIENAFGAASEVDGRSLNDLRRSLEGVRFVPALALLTRFSRRHRLSTQRYGAALASLYRGIASATGARVIVDSSKTPAHGVIVSRLPTVDLYVLQLVRDSRAVAFSWLRKKRRPEVHWEERYFATYGPARSAFKWTFANLNTEFLRAIGDRYMRLRYEDMVARPEETVRAVITWCGEGERDLGFVQADAVTLDKAHTATGNPIRFQTGVVEIRADMEWKEKHWKGRRMVSVMTAFLLKRYGYF